METITYFLEHPWILFLALLPLVAPLETMFLIITIAYAAIVYVPYKITLFVVRRVQGKNSACIKAPEIPKAAIPEESEY